jgi:putative DNA primase/helicase
MLIDEVDTFLADKSDLRGVLNSGHTKSAAFVLRCVGDDSVPQPFSTWCPKVFAHIGRVHPTLEDRSIRIQLRRKLKVQTVKRIPRGHDPYCDLRRRCARFAADNLEALTKSQPKVPPELNDRAADNWEPLLAIAEACGCGEEARQAAIQLSGVDDDETDGIVLLGDLKRIFERATAEDSAVATMPSAAIAEALGKMEDKKWPEFKGGKPITPAQIASLLKPFDIKPRKVQSDDGVKRQVQGYRFDQFSEAFRRYLSD